MRDAAGTFFVFFFLFVCEYEGVNVDAYFAKVGLTCQFDLKSYNLNLIY